MNANQAFDYFENMTCKEPSWNIENKIIVSPPSTPSPCYTPARAVSPLPPISKQTQLQNEEVSWIEVRIRILDSGVG